jgi:uncharacterized protein (DUF486 family)
LLLCLTVGNAEGGQTLTVRRKCQGFKALGLLVLSNVFMTFAWYAHLKELKHKPWLIAVLISWSIAFLST